MQTKDDGAPVFAIGLMSGTSLDGIDVAIIETDGVHIEEIGSSLTIPYEANFQQKLRDLLAGSGNSSMIEAELTIKHAEAVKILLAEEGLSPGDIEVIGFHGQTIVHKPHEGVTVQIGDGKLLAKLTGISVVNDFRSNDVVNGGQGAPLVPVYHRALMRDQMKPVAVLNIGGVANVTWIGDHASDLMAFDTGPGNALINDWIHKYTGKDHDTDGLIAAKGNVDKAILNVLIQHPFFAQKPPKSLDRNSFSTEGLQHLSPEDGAATLTAFTAASVAAGAKYFPEVTRNWIVTGGGRRNATLMRKLADALNVSLKTIDTLDLDGDSTEAEAFAYLAVRSLRGLPLSFPGTTGVNHAATGGVFCPA